MQKTICVEQYKSLSCLVVPRDLGLFHAWRDYWRYVILERLRAFMVLTDHQRSAGPHPQLRLQCSRGRDKLEMGMESSCTESEAQTRQKIDHRAVL